VLFTWVRFGCKLLGKVGQISVQINTELNMDALSRMEAKTIKNDVPGWPFHLVNC